MRATRLLLAALLLLPACAQAPGGTGPGSGGPDPATERAIGVYTTVLSKLIHEEGALQADSPIFILDRVDPDAQDPTASPAPAEPISQDVQRGVVAGFPERDVIFVADAEAVSIPVEEGGGVRDGGMLVTLGPIPQGASRVEVPAGTLCGNLCGTWATYVVELQGEVWKVSGTTGPVAIS